MRWMRISVCLMSMLTLPVGSRAEHNRLLPRPQQVRYGSGRLPVRGLSIRFASAPSAEDRFAAETLARFLSDRAEGPIPVSEERGSDRVRVPDDPYGRERVVTQEADDVSRRPLQLFSVLRRDRGAAGREPVDIGRSNDAREAR